MPLSGITEARLRLASGHNIFIKRLHAPSAARAAAAASPAPAAAVAPTLVLVHGGPGVTDHSELWPYFTGHEALAALQAAGEPSASPPGSPPAAPSTPLLRLVFYDQLGCGRSDKPRDAGQYSLAAYVEELDQVLRWVQRHGGGGGSSGGGRPLFVLGHSWGGQVVLEHLRNCREAAAVSDGDGGYDGTGNSVRLAGAVVSNAPLDETSYEARQRAMRAALDPETAAWRETEEDAAAEDGSVGSLVYGTLVGRGESRVTGAMAGWSALASPSTDARSAPTAAAAVPDDGTGQKGVTAATPAAAVTAAAATSTPPSPLDPRLLGVPLLLITGDDDDIPYNEYPTAAAAAAAGGLDGPVRAVVLPGGDHFPFRQRSVTASYWRELRTFMEEYGGCGGGGSA